MHFLFLCFHKLLLDDVSTVNDRVLEGLGISLHYYCASRNAYLDLDILVVVVREKGKATSTPLMESLNLSNFENFFSTKSNSFWSALNLMDCTLMSIFTSVFCPWMGGFINLFQPGDAAVGIDLCSRQRRMPEKLLYRVEVSPAVKKSRGYGMPEHVR